MTPKQSTALAAIDASIVSLTVAAADLRHGRDGFGYFGEPLPWGASDDIDAYLRANGHTTESKG